MKLGIDLKTSLSQVLTPQQIQYLKLLQLPVVQLEQHIKQEIDMNPMLDEFSDEDDETIKEPEPVAEREEEFESDNAPEEKPEAMIDDEKDPFEFYNMLWQDDSEFTSLPKGSSDEDDNDSFQIKDTNSLVEDLIKQLSLFPLTDEEHLLGSQIIGNIDDDGYLRRELQEIVDETNSQIAEHNFNIQKELYQLANQDFTKSKNGNENPAKQFALSNESVDILKRNLLFTGQHLNGNIAFKSLANANPDSKKLTLLKPINIEQAEKILLLIQQLDPQGIGARNIKECLLAQCKFTNDKSPEQQLAVEILTETYEEFAKKHYDKIKRALYIDDEQLKSAIEYIKTLNPKPGGGDYQSETNVIIPDFIIEIDPETEEMLISLNDNRLPVLKLNTAYEKLKQEAKQRKFNKETKTWLRNKYDDAKFLIQAIRQRKNTMLKVMTAIAKLQEGFFYYGHSALKPLIYKDIAEETGLDISTVCRIVNDKFVQTQFGTYELKYFFSESLPSEEGEEISTTVIKQELKKIIEGESKVKPFSDDALSKLLKETGYNVARRTVAKYREQLKIPVARLRKEI